MAMEIWRGKAADVSKPEAGGPMVCNVGKCKVNVHEDVERAVTEGEEIVVAGPIDENGLQALAVHNLDTKTVRHVDGSNYVLGIGLGGFLGFLGFILSFQFKVDGNMTMSSVNLLMGLAGWGLVAWALSRVLRIKRAAGWVRFVD